MGRRENRSVFEEGALIVARETWDGLLWAARPVQVVADDGATLVHWSPAGSVGCFATGRSYPGREDLPREERQLVSLETRRWYYRGVGARGCSLTFVRDGAWASIAPTWHPDGHFAHWYVNFQRPICRVEGAYETLDLVLDIVVEPDGSWTWKDRTHFDAAMQRGILPTSDVEAVEIEARGIEREIAERTGPFDPSWINWKAPPEWPVPVLPEDFAGTLGIPLGSTLTLDSAPPVH